MAPATVHVVGAGLAGLSAAVRLHDKGRPVVVHEAAGHAGGRCRSFLDSRIDRVIDNGNHLVLSGNGELLKYVAAIGARDQLTEVAPARIAFADLESGQRWLLRPGAPAWRTLQAGHLPPGVSGLALLGDLWKLWRAGPDQTVSDCLAPTSAAFRRLWAPLAVSALNTEVDAAAAAGLWAIVRETLLKGEQSSRPLIAKHGLSDAFVTPAIDKLTKGGAEVRFGKRLRRLWAASEYRVRALEFSGERLELGDGDQVILALPPGAAAQLVEGVPRPERYSAILNLHFALPEPLSLPAGAPFLGILGATAEWVFLRDRTLSVTVSAANRFDDEAGAALASRIWRDVERALELAPGPPPPYRMITEKQATVAQTPAWERLRPAPETGFSNLLLAGDWTGTGIPATLEGAVRSGHRAADLLLGRDPN